MRSVSPHAIILGLLALFPLTSRAQVDSVVVFNEIHYHPADGGEASEFIELYNQNSVNVDLSGWVLEGAGEFLFEKGTTIEGRSYLVIAKDPGGFGDGIEALGPLVGALANNGETLTLRNHNGRIMDRIDYGDSRPWPVGADGSGATLAKRDPLTSSGRADHWAASRGLGGTPGEPNDTAPASGAIVFNEVPPVVEESYWVEVFNAGEEAADLSQFEILAGTGERFPLAGTLEPQAYAQIALDFAPTESTRLFLLDSGREEFLDAVILQDEGRARLDFVSGGRYLTPNAATPGAVNDVSLDDRIVINEIMYHHRPDYADPDNPDSVFRENDEEWIELINRSEETVDLTGWAIRDGVRYDFEEGVLLEPGGFLVVAKDAAALAGKYPDIVVVGDFSGSMTNGDDRIELQDALGNPVDAVHYWDDAPWPGDADGGGSSLELKHPNMDNSLPEAWAASDESLKSEWHTYRYRAVAQRPVYTANVRDFHELRVGYIQAGSCLMDNVSVVEDPDGAKVEMMSNRTFGSLFAPITSSKWRLLGNHRDSEAISDPEAGSVLKIVAESSMNYLNNLCEGTLNKEVEIGKEYEVSFDAKWLSGSPQLRTEAYYNKFAKKHILIVPEKNGTPGRQNTAYLENPGPTYHGLRHHPPVPTDSEEITVSVAAADPDGIDTLTLYYSIDEEAWQTAPMTLEGGEFHGTIPAQARNAVIQFYVEGVDGAGGQSVYPADGPESGAFVRVDNPVDTDQRQSMRLIVRASDSSEIHDALLILSNARRDCTVIMNETDIIYGCGVRQRGSMFSRAGAGAGLNIKFPADQRFRGTQPTVIIRWRNPQEILVKHMANQAIGIPASYNDFLELRGYRSGQTGLIRMEMARFGENYVKGAFENGDREPVFKMEGIRDFQQTGAGGIKRPMPIGWIVQYDLADLGDDKEQYRHVLRMISARRQDDYTPMIDLCKAFSAPDEEFRQAMEAVIDTDQWARMMAVQTLCGIADVYPVENPHNFNFYRRPTDRKIIAIPWDWDFTFNLAATSRIIDPRSSRKNLWRLLEEPGINRLFRGHLLDVIDTVFNERYAGEWFRHYAEVGGTNYNSHISYVRTRASSVRGQASSQTTFRVTTNDGADFSVDAAEVTLQGTAGVRVRTIEHVESGLRLEPDWIDDETWEITLPLMGEVNEINLQARDYQGSKGSLFAPAGSAQLTVTNSGAIDAPQPETLLISEVMYHPAAPSAEEIEAGFADQDLFEFIELTNIGPRAVDLASLVFSSGVQFEFAGLADGRMLQPGEVGLVVADEAAFEKRYGGGLPVLGVYAGNLANGGERLTLTASSGRVIQSFRYDDRDPWPQTADGEGLSLTLSELAGDADPAVGLSWRASGVSGGTPGVLEAPPAEGQSYAAWVGETFSPDELGEDSVSGFNADPDDDGLPNGVEFALGTAAKERGDRAFLSVAEDSGLLSIVFPRRANADVRVVVEVSSDLSEWQALGSERIDSQGSVPVDQGGELHTMKVIPGPSGEYFRLRVSLPE